MENPFEKPQPIQPSPDLSPELEEEVALALEDLARWEKGEASEGVEPTREKHAKTPGNEELRAELFVGISALIALYPLVTQAVARAFENKR